ncbi:hypothetical protein D3C87_1678890 [compost metagenome]
MTSRKLEVSPPAPRMTFLASVAVSSSLLPISAAVTSLPVWSAMSAKTSFRVLVVSTVMALVRVTFAPSVHWMVKVPFLRGAEPLMSLRTGFPARGAPRVAPEARVVAVASCLTWIR